MQTDLEEAKAQEIAKLQDALHEKQLQVEEANSMVIKEREAARKAIEEAPPVIKETPVIVQDTERINSLISEVEKLKVCMRNCQNENHFSANIFFLEKIALSNINRV